MPYFRVSTAVIQDTYAQDTVLLAVKFDNMQENAPQAGHGRTPGGAASGHAAAAALPDCQYHRQARLQLLQVCQCVQAGPLCRRQLLQSSGNTQVLTSVTMVCMMEEVGAPDR